MTECYISSSSKAELSMLTKPPFVLVEGGLEGHNVFSF